MPGSRDQKRFLPKNTARALVVSLLLCGCATRSTQFDAQRARNVRAIAVATNIFVPDRMEFPPKKESQVKPEGVVDGAASAIGKALFRFEQVDPEEEMRKRTDIDELVTSSLRSALMSNLAQRTDFVLVGESDPADATFFVSVDRIGLMETAFSEFTAGMKPFIQVTAMMVSGSPCEVRQAEKPVWMVPVDEMAHPVVWKDSTVAYGTWRGKWGRGYYYRHFMYEPEMLRKSLRADAARAADALVTALQEKLKELEEASE